MVLLAGVIAIETNFGAMVTLAEPLTPPIAAVTDTAPLAVAVSTPPALTEARPAGDTFQVTCEVRSCVLPSLYLPVAVSCTVSPTVGVALAALTLRELSLAPPPPPFPEPPPAHAKVASRQLSTMANNTLRVEKITEVFIANLVEAIQQPKERP